MIFLMQIHHHPDKDTLGKHVAETAARHLREALETRGQASLVVATGASQFETLDHLIRQPEIAWSKITAFHMDEYVALPESHPASFRRFLKERFANLLPEPLKTIHFIDGEVTDLRAECARLNQLIASCEIDVLLGGIGENAHLAFNDPPADFAISDGYHVVDLDTDCRKQQVGEGWFDSLEQVPRQAISITIQETMRAKHVLIACPDTRKAQAVKLSVEGPVTNDVPASILQKHPDAHLFLDPASASALSG